MQQRREKRFRIILLIAAIVVFSALVYISAKRGFWGMGSTTQESETSPSETIPLRTLISPETAQPSPPGYFTPADQWAAALLERYQEMIFDRIPAPASGGLVWWDAQDQSLPLQFIDDHLVSGGNPFTIAGREVVELFIPDNDGSANLIDIARIENRNGILTLTLKSVSPSTPNSQWLISAGDPDMALQSLAYKVQEDNNSLEVAFEEEADGSIRIILVAISQAERATPTPNTPTPTSNALPTITLIPSRTPMPTSTRTPEEYLGRIIAEKVAMAFSSDWVVSPTTLSGFVSSRPWIGLLSWSETGPTIGTRQTAVSEATTLTIYLLLDEESDTQEKLVTFTYDDESDATRIPSDQVYFQGRRMTEILYWLFRAAADNNGQFNLAYDDFGSSQALTIIEFIPFD